MVKCPFCQVNNVDNTIFCSGCGASLLEDDKPKTEPLAADERNWLGQPPVPETEPTVQLGVKSVAIRLKIGPRKRVVELPLDKIIQIGRLDPASGVFPDVDVTADIAPEKNVSRRHAVLYKQEDKVVIEDAGSINGTFVNGKRLEPFEPESLSDGDTLQLGRLLIAVEILTRWRGEGG